MSERNEIKYPKEIDSVVRTKTFCINAELTKPDTDNGDSPLKLYSRFSRFPITLINEKKVFANANINVTDMIDIMKRSEFAYNKEMELSMQTQTIENDVSSAYTVQISSGMLKGKTPAQALLESPDNLKALVNQFNFLKQNLDKYPRNRVQMQAIKEAKTLFESGKLTESKAQGNTNNFEIYKSGFRPLKRKSREDGMCFVYDVKITWNFKQNYPLEIEIQNYYAPVTTDDRGMMNVQFSQRDKNTFIKESMKLSASEWNHIMYMTRTNMEIFERSIGNQMLKISKDASWQPQSMSHA